MKFKIAAKLLSLLALAIPLDFVASFCGTLLVSAGKDAAVTVGMLIGAAANVVLNIAWIPHYGAMGAASATVASYGVVVCALILPSLFVASGRSGKKMELVPSP